MKQSLADRFDGWGVLIPAGEYWGEHLAISKSEGGLMVPWMAPTRREARDFANGLRANGVPGGRAVRVSMDAFIVPR